MQIHILISIRGLKIDEISADKQHLINLGFGHLLSYEALHKLKFFEKDFLQHYGQVFFSDTFNSGCWCALSIERNVSSMNDHEIFELVKSETHFRMKVLEGYLGYLWFIRDNSISPNIVYAFIKENKNSYNIGHNLNYKFAADGKIKTDISFTENEIKYVQVVMDAYSKITENHNITQEHTDGSLSDSQRTMGPSIVVNTSSAKHYDDFNRIERAMMFLAKARSEHYVPLKVSFYMPVFEALFAYESEGVNFKVPIRVGNYIGKDAAERKAIFDKIRFAYNIRSRFLHGDKLNTSEKKVDQNKKMKKGYVSMEDVYNSAKEVDEILRRVLTKVVMHDSEKFLCEQGTFVENLNDLIFQLRNTGTSDDRDISK